jgi:hypothetical protein
MKKKLCFGCGKEFYELRTPMRCCECAKNGIQIQTSPVKESYFILSNGDKGKFNQEK